MKCANPECNNEVVKIGYKDHHKKYCSPKCCKYHFYCLHKQKIIKRAKKWVQENRDKFLKIKKLNTQRHKEILSDSYVRNIITSNNGIIPDNKIIEQRRLSIKLKRLIHEKQREVNTRRDHGRANNVLS